MYHANAIEVQVPIDEFIDLFLDQTKFKHWRPGFQSVELLSGEKGQYGVKSKFVYQLGKRPFEVIETVTERNFPYIFSAHYQAPNMVSDIDYQFEDFGGKRTMWGITHIYRLSGSKERWSWLRPKFYEKQDLQLMLNLKDYAENGVSILDKF